MTNEKIKLRDLRGRIIEASLRGVHDREGGIAADLDGAFVSQLAPSKSNAYGLVINNQCAGAVLNPGDIPTFVHLNRSHEGGKVYLGFSFDASHQIVGEIDSSCALEAKYFPRKELVKDNWSRDAFEIPLVNPRGFSLAVFRNLHYRSRERKGESD